MPVFAWMSRFDARPRPSDVLHVLFLSERTLPLVIATAEQIRDIERRQAGLMARDRSLREQCRFDEYLRNRKDQPSVGFREHLRAVNAAIET